MRSGVRGSTPRLRTIIAMQFGATLNDVFYYIIAIYHIPQDPSVFAHLFLQVVRVHD